MLCSLIICHDVAQCAHTLLYAQLMSIPCSVVATLQAKTYEESPSKEDWQSLVDSIKQRE